MCNESTNRSCRQETSSSSGKEAKEGEGGWWGRKGCERSRHVHPGMSYDKFTDEHWLGDFRFPGVLSTGLDPSVYLDLI